MILPKLGKGAGPEGNGLLGICQVAKTVRRIDNFKNINIITINFLFYSSLGTE